VEIKNNKSNNERNQRGYDDSESKELIEDWVENSNRVNEAIQQWKGLIRKELQEIAA